jgi:hypothetical protein
MRGVRFFPVFLSSILATSALARPVLVAVELPDRESVKHWYSLDHPTFAHLENSAIAEFDESDLSALAHEGFAVEVIDRSPWNESYVICFRQTSENVHLDGVKLWQRGSVSLWEVPSEKTRELRRKGLDCEPMRKTPLPDRFWEALTEKYVPLKSLEWDPWIQGIVDEVSEDSLTTYIQRLIAFETRYASHESCYAAAEWLMQRLSAWGYPTEIQTFSNQYAGNVVASKNGDSGGSETEIMGGHYDSISESSDVYAPGADDNATGAAGTLEAARVLANDSFDHTLRFICWGAEELGKIGSGCYVEEAVSNDLEIGGYVNLDMIGYMDDDLLDCHTQSEGSFSYPLVRLFIEAAATYVPLLTVSIDETPGSSDWRSFIQGGYPAVGGMERDGTHFNPYYHSTEDDFSTLSPELYTAITKTAVATMAILGVSPPTVREIVVHDMGDGCGLVVRWEACDASDIIGYSIQWGMESEAYSDSDFVYGGENNTFALTDLQTDSTYYFVIRAHDADGYESWVATEVSGVPRLIPRAPSGVTATPIAAGIRIDWQRNNELDIAGYRVYRRINEATGYDSLNVDLIPDTTFTDAQLTAENKYYYAVKAVDDSENYSPLSEEVYGRPVTLDQGILIVDETTNTPNHPDSLQDAFYRYLLEGYRYSEVEYGTDCEIVLADFVPYSTLVWHADEYMEPLAWERAGDLGDYLDAGGKLWFTGWMPALNLTDETAYPLSFSSGDFMYDYFGISYVERSSPSDSFEAAAGEQGFPVLEIDPDKVPVPSWGPTLRYVEALSIVPPTEHVYTIDLTNDNSLFQNGICGVRNIGSDLQIVYFGFPLYFMDQDQAREVAQKVMSDFGELPVDGDAPGGPRVTELQLLQNTPNPFSERTMIRYHIPKSGPVNLGVYDLGGRLISTLVAKSAGGGENGVTWDGTDTQGGVVANGVYFYRLQYGNRTLCRKLVLIR